MIGTVFASGQFDLFTAFNREDVFGVEFPLPRHGIGFTDATLNQGKIVLRVGLVDNLYLFKKTTNLKIKLIIIDYKTNSLNYRFYD